MRIVKGIFNFYINSSIHVALAVYALSWLTLLNFDLKYNAHLLYVVFFATISGYNFVKYFGLAKLFHRRLTNRLKIIQIFSFVCFLALCYYVFQLETIMLFYVGALGLMTFLYAIPVIPKKVFLDENQNLRSISGLKIYIIALVWTGVTVGLPLLNADYPMTDDVVITALQRFLFIMVLMLPFEIRDLSIDSLKLATIPQKIGVMHTKIIGVIVLLVFFVLEFLKDYTDWVQVWILGIITAVTLLFLIFSTINQKRYYSSFLVEAIPIIWLVLTLLF